MKSRIIVILSAFLFMQNSKAHTDSLGWTIAPGSSSGLYLVNIYYGTWHNGNVSAEGSLNLVGTAGVAAGNPPTTPAINRNSVFTIFSTSDNPSAPLPNGLTLGTNYFYPNTSTSANNDFTASGSRNIYGFQRATFTDIPTGTYTFGYAAGPLTVVWTPSDPAINAGTFTIDSGGVINVVGAPSSIPNINTAVASYTSVQLAAGSVNPAFEGGTLQMSAPGTVTNNFTINTLGGTIDTNGVNATFSGVISNLTTNGALSKIGTGTLILAGVNTYTGGTTITAGTLQISADNNLGGSGGVTLAGGKLAVTETIGTSRNFTLSSGTSSSIEAAVDKTYTINGVISGSGGVSFTNGTISLSGVNTYSGATNINGGATLALVNSASIANSSAVTVTNGNFNIAGASGNINLAGTYTQEQNGNLAMSFSPTNNQNLIIAGAASLAGGINLTSSAGPYSPGRYSIISANSVSGTFGSLTTDLSSYTRLGYALAYDLTGVYLVLTPNVSDTQQSLVNTASVLQGTFTLQNSVMVNGFTYDCPLFDKYGICISAGGRNTTVQAQGINNTSGLLIAAYRLDKNNSRVGAWVDQNLSISGPGTVKLGNTTPMIGLFGVWSERPDGVGAEVKVAAAYGQKDVTVTRQVVNTSEPGSGSSQLFTQGAQLVAKYGFSVLADIVISPYAGVRYTQNNMGGYTEATTSAVTSPLTYSALNTNATTALAGAEVKFRGIPQTTLYASAGVETDTNTSNGTYSATGLSGLTPINFNPNPVKTRPTATLGGYYDIMKNHRIGITGIYRQEPFQAVSTTTVIATYTIGL